MTPEMRVNRNPTHRDPLRRKPQQGQISLRLIQRDKVAMKGSGKPHRVKVIVGHHNRQLGLNDLLGIKWEIISAGIK